MPSNTQVKVNGIITEFRQRCSVRYLFIGFLKRLSFAASIQQQFIDLHLLVFWYTGRATANIIIICLTKRVTHQHASEILDFFPELLAATAFCIRLTAKPHVTFAAFCLQFHQQMSLTTITSTENVDSYLVDIRVYHKYSINSFSYYMTTRSTPRMQLVADQKSYTKRLAGRPGK